MSFFPAIQKEGKEDDMLPALNASSLAISRETAYHCKICDKYYASYKSYGNHMRSYHGTNKEKAKCPYCGNCFTRRDNLQQHIKLFHCSIKKQFLCKYCKEPFLNRNSCTKHKLKCSQKQEDKDQVKSDALRSKVSCDVVAMDISAVKNGRYSPAKLREYIEEVDINAFKGSLLCGAAATCLNSNPDEDGSSCSPRYRKRKMKWPSKTTKFGYIETHKQQASVKNGFQHDSELTSYGTEDAAHRKEVTYRDSLVNKASQHKFFKSTKFEKNSFISNNTNDSYPQKVMVQLTPQQPPIKHEDIFTEYMSTVRNLSRHDRFDQQKNGVDKTNSLKEQNYIFHESSRYGKLLCKQFSNCISSRIGDTNGDHVERLNGDDNYGKEGIFECSSDVTNGALDCNNCNITFLTRNDYEDHKPFCEGGSFS